MNYTIIGHTEDSSYHDRCGDYISQPGNFETQFFREEQKEDFIKAWAYAQFHSTYEDLLILVNGVPEDRLEDGEWDQFELLQAEMHAAKDAVKIQHDIDEKAAKEKAAQAALEQARRIAQQQRDHDLKQLEALKRKLGV